MSAQKPHPLVGSRAPDFSLVSTQGPGSARRSITLDDFRDRWLLLLFYPRDFTLICPTELSSISQRIEEFQKRECDVIGVSTDPIDTHEQWIGSPVSQGGLGGLRFPLAADDEGAAAQAYGVYLARQNVALRGLFIIDPNGVLQYMAVNNLSVGRSSEEILRVLDALQSGGLCPSDWKASQPVLNVADVTTPNTLLGPYRVEQVIGKGSFGIVVRAHDTLLRRPVALKIFRDDHGLPKEALLAEARAAAALNHPNVCIVYAVETELGAPVIVMEYLDGEPLAKRLERGALSLRETRTVGRQIALGMASAHGHGVIHGDLKPANIMIVPNDLAKIMDFGLARRFQTRASLESTLLQPNPSGNLISGTPAYMSPEQARGEDLTPATDVFSFGLVLYEMATGRRAVDANHMFDALRRIEQLDAEPLAARMPAPLDALLRQMLARDPAARTITMARVAELLE